VIDELYECWLSARAAWDGRNRLSLRQATQLRYVLHALELELSGRPETF
jgi:hypothetical protein